MSNLRVDGSMYRDVRMKIFFVVQGLFEKSDSIGYDCVYQYRLSQEIYPQSEIGLYAEKYDRARYPDVVISDFSMLLPKLDDPEAVVIYHYCDSWPRLENLLRSAKACVIIRWHNNTPPWFFGKVSLDSVKRTIAGFDTIRQLGVSGRYFFMCNSDFTRRQLRTLGIRRGILPKVYPASRFLDLRDNEAENKDYFHIGADTFNLLFVGRIVAHKGHRHVLRVARSLSDMVDQQVSVCFPGRGDDSAYGYMDELKELAAKLGIAMHLPGEVDDGELDALYASADAFVCLSEHEGFGLPVYEAMTRGVPVAVLAGTAFAEVLGGHPLSFSELDYDTIAVGLARLQLTRFYREVVNYQREEILPEYTKDVVTAQLTRAINVAGRATANQASDGDAVLARETENNYVTVYDIESYQSLLQAARGHGLIGHWLSQHIACEAFLTMAGRVKASPVVMDDLDSDGHLIFGPYMELPKGAYRVTFDLSVRLLDFERKSSLTGWLILDVCTRDILSSLKLPVSQVDVPSMTSLDFVLDEDVSGLEFRVKSEFFDREQGISLVFGGVTLSKINVNHFDGMSEDRAEQCLSSLEQHKLGAITLIPVDELLAIRGDSEFVGQCYKRILGRAADDGGMRTYTAMLNNDRMTKLELIEILARSDEGVVRNIKLI